MSGRSFSGLFLVFAGITALLAANPGAAAEAKFNRKVVVGDPAPKFSRLVGTDEKLHSLFRYGGGRRSRVHLQPLPSRPNV